MKTPAALLLMSAISIAGCGQSTRANPCGAGGTHARIELRDVPTNYIRCGSMLGPMEIVLRAGVQERHSGPPLAAEVMAVIVPCPPMDLRTGESYEVCINESPPEIKYRRLDYFRPIHGPRLYTRFLGR